MSPPAPQTPSEPTGFHSVTLPFNPWEHIHKVFRFTSICMKNLWPIEIEIKLSFVEDSFSNNKHG
jgi:hypothetical protein